MRWLVFALVIVVDWMRPVPARACSFIGPTPFAVDPAMQGTDQQAPMLGPLSVVRVVRGQGPVQDGCGARASSCDGTGSFTIGGAATDDLTPAAKIGYRFSIAGGRPPDGFTPPTGTVSSVAFVDQIVLIWDDGDTDDQESFDFTLAVVAVDLAGNESAPQMVRIADDTGDGGCSVVAGSRSRGASMLALAWLAAGVAVARRRPRRAGHPKATT